MKNLGRLFAMISTVAALQSCNLGSYPNSAEDWDKSAVEKYLREEYDLACNDWDQAVKFAPDNPDYWWKRSRATMRFGREQQSIDDAKKSIELLGDKDPRKLIYYNLQLAEAYQQKTMNAEAQATFDKTLEMAEGTLDAAPVYMERGRFFVGIGEFEKAISDLNKAIALVPTWGRAYYYRGKAYEGNHVMAKAVDDYLKAKEMNYDNLVDRWEPLPLN
jgi:tetratricopeptide (TPR) repeat protein